MISDNHTVFGKGRFSWGEFDRLQAALRWVLNDSAFDMATDYVVQQLNEGASPYELEMLDAAISVRAARQAYGSRYPVARRGVG